MRAFYKKIMLFLIPVLIVWLGVEVFYRTVETNYTVKNAKIMEGYDQIEVLILGNSHTLYGLNPDYFDRPTFNAANISQSLYFDELILNKHIDSLERLKAVIIPISYFSLSQKDDSSEDRWRKYFYDQQMAINVPSVANYDIKKYSLALSRKFRKSADLIHQYISEGTVVGCYPNGYGIQDESNIVEDKVATSKIIARKHEDGSTDFRQNLERIDRIISSCKQRDIKLILIEMPVHPAYFELLDFDKTEKISNSLAMREVNNPHHVWHLDWKQRDSFVDSDLRDADHLTNEGAKKCSEMVNDILETEVIQF